VWLRDPRRSHPPARVSAAIRCMVPVPTPCSMAILRSPAGRQRGPDRGFLGAAIDPSAVIQAVCSHCGAPGDIAADIRDPAAPIGGTVPAEMVARVILELLKPPALPVENSNGALLSWWMSGMMVLSD
jgi:hypothetical protein